MPTRFCLRPARRTAQTGSQTGISLAAIALAASITVWADVAQAQPVPSRDGASTHVFPAGGRRGTRLAVRIGTECFPPQTALRLWAEGVTAPEVLGPRARGGIEPSPRRKPTEIPINYPKEWESEFDIAADAPLGPIYWRLTCAGGGTSARPFVVGDLPEFIESESNSVPERAERVELPVTINGRIAGERDVDYFRFHAKAGQTVVCELLARRLGSPLDSVIEILDPAGTHVDTTQIHRGSDPVIAFGVKNEGEHLLRIAQVGVHGGPHFVYRATLSTEPCIAFAFPAGGRAGATISPEFYLLDGSSAAKVQAAGRWPILSAGSVMIPAGAEAVWQYRGSEVGLSGVTFDVGSLPEIIESASHSSAEAAQSLDLPVTVNGRFLAAGEEDWYRFGARAGERLAISCRAPRGSSAMPVLDLLDASGKLLVRANAAEADDRQCRLEWVAPADGTFCLRLRDLQHLVRGDASLIYRLSVEPARPDFSLAMKADFVNVEQGGKSTLEMAVLRRGGFDGPVSLTVAGLPAGVTLESSQVPAGQSRFSLTLTADGSVPSQAASLKIVGRAEIASAAVERTARAPHAGIDSEGASLADSSVDHLLLTIRHKPVFRLFCNEAYQYAHRGTIYPYLMEVERLGGFDGEIFVELGDRQNRDLDGIEMLEMRIPPGQSQGQMPIFLPETMHINVQSQSQLYTQGHAIFDDEHGRRQSMLVVSEKRNMVRTLPTVAKLSVPGERVTLRRGGSAACRVRLQRTANFDGPLEVTLVRSAGTSPISAEPTIVAAGQTEAVVELLASGEAPRGAATLILRGTGALEGGARVVTETQVRVMVD